jgi:hypothetical protein
MKQIQHQVQLCPPAFIEKGAPLRMLLLHQLEGSHRFQDGRCFLQRFQHVPHAMS